MKKHSFLVVITLLTFSGIVAAQQNPYENEKTINGITIFEDGNKSGIKNSSGKTIVKPNNYIKKHIGHGFVSARYWDYKKGTETLLVYNPKGEIVSGPVTYNKEYEEFRGKFELDNHFRKGLLNYFSAAATGRELRFGLMDSLGNKLTQTKYISIDMRRLDSVPIIRIKDETYPIGLFGYMDQKGNEIIKPQYQMATYFDSEGKYALVKNTQWQVIDPKGKVVFTPPYNLLMKEDESYLCGMEKCYEGTIRKGGYFVMKSPDGYAHLLSVNGLDRVIYNDEYQDFLYGKLQAQLNREEYARQEEAVKVYNQQQADKTARTGYYLVHIVVRYYNGDQNSNYIGGKNMDVSQMCNSVCIRTSNPLDAKTYAAKFWPQYNKTGEQFKQYTIEPCLSESDCHTKAQQLDKYKRTVHVNNDSWKGSDKVLGTHEHDMQLRILD